MSTRIRTLNFLPEIFQTKTNAQFLAATLDQVVAQPETKKIEGYVGSKIGYGINAKDYYVTEPTKTRTDYQLDPGVVFTKTNESTAQDFISYPGILDALKLEGGLTDNNNRLFNSEFYSWDSFTNLDKIINFNQYYWIPEGPASVVVASETVYYNNDYIVYDEANSYGIVPASTPNSTGSSNPTLTLLRGGTYTFAVNQNSQFWIQGEPGVTGYSPSQPNVQTREVLGVDNNGATIGIVTFTVPQKDAQDQYNFPGNNLVDVVSTLPFSQINGARLSDLPNGIDGITSLNGLTVMFYNTGIPSEVGYISNFFDYTPYDEDNNLTSLNSIAVTQTSALTKAITCSSTTNLVVNNAIIFNGTPFGGISEYSSTLPNTIYFVESILNPSQFTISPTLSNDYATHITVGKTYRIITVGTTNFVALGASSNTPGLIFTATSSGTLSSGTGVVREIVNLTTSTGSMTAVINQGQYEQGYYTNVNEHFYKISCIGDPSNPVIRLTQYNEIPVNQKITATYGTEWISRNFYRNTSGYILIIPYLSAQLDTLYYQDGTSENKVGVIRLIESNFTNRLNVERDILGKPQYTSTNNVVFTNGLKVVFRGDIYPTSYLSGEYYVEGVGTAIELLPVTDFIVPEDFTSSTYTPWDILGWDSSAWEGNSYVPVSPDYITISRNSIDKNAWSRSNRWFHIDVINATAVYNNNPDLVTLYTLPDFKAKRPIIEFYPNLKLFNSGVLGKAPVDFIDVRTTDAFSYVAGQQNYYPDVEVYTGYTASISSTNYTPIRQIISGNSTTGVFTTNTGYNTTGFNVNDLIIFDNITPGSGFTAGGPYYIAEIISSTQFKLSATKNGDVIIPNISVTGPYQFTWSPQSATITVSAADVIGPISVGQYIADSTNVLPRNSQIVSISGTTTLTITLDWDEGSNYFTAQTNVSLVASATTVDNYALFDGARIIFTADTDENIKNKIFISRFSSINGSTPILTLTKADDGDVAAFEQTVALRGYYNHGKEFFFDGLAWVDGQQKTTLNQPPLFNVFDSNGVSFGNTEVYSGTSFIGSKLFSYGIGSGLDDTILGFPIRYSSVDNVGDISFDVSFNLDTFNYVSGSEPVTQNVNTGYVYQYKNLADYSRQIGWQTAVSPSIQYQIFEFNYDPLVSTNVFTCDIAKVDSSYTKWPTIKVLVNNKALTTTDYSVNVGPDFTKVTLNQVPLIETEIQILLLSEQVSKTAYYQIPTNLNNNPLNEDITVANVGDIRRQYQSMFFNNPNSIGQVFGKNNFRDLGNMVPWGNEIIQNSASLALPGTFLRKQEHNLFNALLFNSKEYIKFKNLLVYTVQNTDYIQRYDPAALLDNALDQITSTKDNSQPFFWSDMLPSKSAYVVNTYSFANSLDVSIYPLTRVYDFTQANYYGVLVYLTRTTNGLTNTTQLIKNIDYVVSTTAPSLTINTDLLPGDVITIKEYNQTYGSYVPNTPTKLGLYPSYIPKVVLDNDYNTPTYFIRGHDGSYNKLYGEYDPITGILVDFRDQVLLEFETRVYNNLKISATIPVKEYEVTPGYFRTIDYSYADWLGIYSESFLNWVGQNRLNYKTQYFNSSDSFTYNYYQSGNAIDKTPITQGYWRGIYQYYYDTTTPNTTPWEMLGFTEMPSWWTSRYGPAPYTSDNLVLWGDLEQGLVWNNGDSYVDTLYARPGLLGIIPVDSSGNLLPPLDAMVGSYNQKLFQRDWKVGDCAPVELSYRRSSSYPFDLMRLLALTKPAKFFNLGVDVDLYKYNFEFNQYLVNDRSHLKLSDIKIYGNGTPVTSYINWIVDYEKQVGIDATENIQELFNNVDVRLVYRLAGFSDKTLLKFYVEKGTPNSRNASLLIPDENYGVLLYDNQPFNRITYSGVIVQRSTTGFTVYGNSQIFAFFKTLKPKFAGNYRTIEVENTSVKVTTDHYDVEQIVPYNTTFFTIQEVAQFLVDYGAYLESLGMKFQDQENEIIIDWDQMVAEFLYWAQTGWADGSLVTLNPAAKKLYIDKDSNIVQPLTIQQSNFVLNQNLYPINLTDLAINRQGTAFNVDALNQGDTIAYGQFNLSNFEHGIVFDNVTLFGDVIYNLITGLRQNRIVLRGTKSAFWDGTVNAAGFIYNQNNIKEWSKTTKYTKGEIVTYKNKYWVAIKVIQPSEVFKEENWKRTDYNEIQKGLLPNPSTRSYESTLYYDVDKANLENDADLLSFSLIGYRPRDYLALADLTDITQVNVYKHMIKEKGTLNIANAFKGAQLPQGGIDYTIYENWAIKSGEFGGTLNNSFIEFKLNQKYLTGNPSIVGLTNGIYNIGVQQEVPLYSLFNYGAPITSVDVLPTTSTTTPSMLFPDAGYVNFNDVKMSAFYYSQLPTAVNKSGSIIPVQNFYVNDYVWLANYLEKWDVLTPISIGQIISVKNNLNETLTVTFNKPHNLSEYTPFIIVNFDNAVDGYYLASVVVDTYRVLVTKTLDPSIKEIVGQGIGLKLYSQRVNTPAEIVNLPLLNSEFRKTTVWVDTNTDGGWGVYRKGINYQLQNQITKTESQSLGSAVAIGDRLGYLISDADLGKVYRYTFNELTQQFNLVQEISGNVGFGSTISYANDLYAISQPTGSGRTVKLYQLQNTKISDDLVLIQSITNPVGVTTWGSSIAISGDESWIYISDIDNNSVHLYLKSTTPTTAGYFIIGDTYTITSIGTTDFTTVGATSNDVGITFIASGIGSGTGTATNSTYRPVTIIDGDALGLTSLGDKFGYSISTDHDGDCVIIGAPGKDYGSISNWGYSYVFDRIEQKIEAQNGYLPAVFPLIWTPTSLTANVTATNSTGNKITLNVALDPVEDINKPVMFAGTSLVGTNIIINKIYYIASVSGFNITIKETRESASNVTLVTVGSITNAKAYVQTEQLNVYKNGTLVEDNNYAAVTNTLVYLGTIEAGDIITVSGYEIVLVQTLTTENSPQIGAQFGLSVDANTHASELLIGAPFQLVNQLQEGVVYRFTDAGAKYGVVTGITDCNVTTTRQILINGFRAVIPAGNAEIAAKAINNSSITNIMATALGGKLVISLINNELAPINQKLFLSFDDEITIQELGFEIYVKTQEILCPHKYGPTQFGTVVKFNQYDSFIVSAPAGTRYEATTFDFSDDENQDNDTIFDNNATEWIDETPNFGAVYMFDYISQYNPNINNTGKFIYAQSVNSPNIVNTPFNTYNQATDITTSNQPRYGTALDFNGYNVIVGTPGDVGATSGTTFAGSTTVYNNSLGKKDWSIYRYSAPVVDINKVFNIQMFSAETNNTLVNMDYIDPLQGKILGAARENIDIVSNSDPAVYNNTVNVPNSLVWGAAQIGQVWLNTSDLRYVNYHQNDDVVYNSQYWGTLFPGSDVAVYSWVTSNVLPAAYTGPGIPYDVNSYSIQYVINAEGALTPVYFFWARNTNTVFTDNNKTLADSIVASYIANPKGSGISYLAPILPSVYGLYNSNEYINATDTVLHIGYATGSNDDTAHSQYNLIRADYADDFLPGLPRAAINAKASAIASVNEINQGVPTDLYARLLDSLSGTNIEGGVVPDPFLPKAVQSGVLARPRQSFFLDRLGALKNLIQFINEVLLSFPFYEDASSTFLFTQGSINPSTVDNPNWNGPVLYFYDTSNYIILTNWWAPGYDNNTRSSLQVQIYSDLETLQVPIGTIVTVNTNADGFQETYIFDETYTWKRIGLQNGTIQISSAIYDYAGTNVGFGNNFWDTDPYDTYPSEETRNIVRGLCEEMPSNLLIYRNKGLILLFEYIQSESAENQNYLPWLNKTSFIDVLHTIRELRPIEVFQSDNQDFLSGYLNEIKPYHVVIKEFLFNYTGTEFYSGNITDFDLPAKYNKNINQFITPQLVYANPNGVNQFLPSDPIWQEPEYKQWYSNHGVSLTGQNDVQITTLASYIALNSNSFAVDNAHGFPINGVITIGKEDIGFSNVDRELNVISGLTRGVNGTTVSTHIPGELIYIDLPAIVLINGGRGYTEPPKVVAYIDTTIYPEPTVPAQLAAIMNLDSVLEVQVVNPGQGYAVLPKIVIDPAVVVTFSSTDVNTLTSTVQLFAPLLQTGDLIQYKVGENSTAIGGLEDGQWYYINVLETVPSVIVGFYDNYAHAINNHDRLVLYSAGTGDSHTLNMGARGSAISTSVPVRENNITLRFDRTTYNSDIIEWEAGKYYGSYYAGAYNNRLSVSSSSITLQASQPPVSTVLASAQGVTFEITDVRNDRIIDYSSFIRIVVSTQSSDNSVRLLLQDDGSSNPNASGGTNGFYIGMPVKFTGTTLGGFTLTATATTSGSNEITLSSVTNVKVNDPINFVGTSFGGLVTGTTYYVLTVNTITSKITVSETLGGTTFVVTNGSGSCTTNLGGVRPDTTYYVSSVLNQTDFTLSMTSGGTTINVASATPLAAFNCYAGQVSDTAIITVNYPGILNITATKAVTNNIITPLNPTGTGGTQGFYIGIPVFFTGTDNTKPFNGVFGGIIENQIYYVTTIIDSETFTISETQNPQMFTVLSTVASNDTVIIDVEGGGTERLSLNEPIIFNNMFIAGVAVTNFGGLVSGETYYVSAIVSSNSFKVSTQINGTTESLTDVAAAINTSSVVTSQKDTVDLINATGNTMVVNVNLPVSPGQINGQRFTLYQTSNQYPTITGQDTDLIHRGVAALIGNRTVMATNLVAGETYTILTLGSSNFTLVGASSNTIGVTFVATGPTSGTGTVTAAVNKIVLTNLNPGDSVNLWLTNLYVNMPLQISDTLGSGFLTSGTTYYIVQQDIIEIAVTSTSSSGNTLTCSSTESLFIDMPIVFSGTSIGGVLIGVDYWVKQIVDDKRFILTNTPGGAAVVVTTDNGSMVGTGLPYIKVATTLGGSAVNPGDTQQTATITIASPAVITVSSAPATGTKVFFRTTGSLPSGIVENIVYYVTNLSSTTFKLSLTPTGAFINTTGTQSGIHTMIVDTAVDMNQTPLSIPVFDVSYILGGYRVVITDSASGYAVDNIITISGIELGGSTPTNNLTLTVSSVGTYGEILSLICAGTPAGAKNQYYVKVISPTELQLYANKLLTVPVSGLSLPYVGTTMATVTYLNSGTEQFTISDASNFEVNDGVVFTGDLTPAVGAIVQGQTYYITSIVGNNITVSEEPNGTNINISTSIAADFTIAKFGSFAFLPEPFTFNQSIVKYNGRVYECVISNNDKDFVIGKWQLLTSGDRKLNALDRAYGYYEPTDNMPGRDLSQLFEGIIYPNSTYLGNQFQPSLQYPIDTILQDQPFYPTEVDITSVIWNGTRYEAHQLIIGVKYRIVSVGTTDFTTVGAASNTPGLIFTATGTTSGNGLVTLAVNLLATTNTPTYSAVLYSEGADWTIKKLTNTPIGTTDMIYAGGYYVLTSTNSATPLFRSEDGITWASNGYFTPWGSTPYDDTNWDMTALNVSSLYLNSIGYRNGVWVAVGQNIISSDDTYIWRERLVFENSALTNQLYSVSGVGIPAFTGFIAVGQGQEYDYSTGTTLIVTINLIYTSIDGVTWNYVQPVSRKGMYGVASNSNVIIAVGEDGIIYICNNGTNWLGVNEVQVLSANSATNELILTSTGGFTVNDPIKFSTSFNIFTAGTTYYIKAINSSTQITVSATPGGSTLTLSSVNPSSATYMFAPRTASLRDILYANGVFIAVGDSGLIKKSTNGYSWTQVASGTTENLNGITFNSDDAIWIVSGDNNTILTSTDNGTTWTSSLVFAPQTTIYDVKGDNFEFGYGPEELVPGVVTDNLSMIVATRPGTNWDATIYQHVGYNVVSIELIPTSATQTVYSFDVGNLYNVQSPVKIAVFVIDGTTGLGQSIYQPAYSVNWVANTITLATPLTFLPVANRLRINVYEVGNGNQLVKSSTKTDPIRTNSTTGWNEIYVDCHYTGEIYNGSGVIRPNTFPVDVLAIETDSKSNSILCENVKNFVLNDPIRFQGNVFGNIQEDTTYYVKTISYISKRITISTTVNPVTGTAGPTFDLVDGTGSMEVIVKVGYGAPWTSPIIYHNGTKLVMGTTSTVTRTKSSNNAITTNTTDGMIVGETIRFSDTIFGGVLQPQTTYYIKSIVDDNEFTVSAILGGPTLALTNATGGAEFITNDYAFGIADNGITASIIFSKPYNASVDYLTYTLFGETTPIQYGYTIPETQIIIANGTVGPFNLINYVGEDNPTNAIVEVNGLRLTNTAYTIDSNTNKITFTSAPTVGSTIAITSFNLTDRQYFNTQFGLTGKTVSKISDINNSITPYSLINVSNTTSGTNYITCASTSSLSAGQTIIFKGGSPVGNIQIDGTVYFVKQVINSTQFTISTTPGGAVFTLSTASGTLIGYAGGQPAVRVTTSAPHNLTTNDKVRIDGTLGSAQLNNQTFYVHVIDSTQVDLYSAIYNPALNAENYPVTDVSSYSSGGYIWKSESYVIVTANVTQTTTDPILGNYLTVPSTSKLVDGTPIIFTGTSLGGVSLNTRYYIRQVINATTFSISETRYGEEVVLTNAVGSMQVTQWEQENVDRIWITVNGYRVPSSSLRINNGVEISILTQIQPTDEVIITSMMPSATPNQEVYLLNVNQTNESTVYRANTQTRTWLTKPLSNTDSTIYVYDVTRVTDSKINSVIAPSPIDGIYNVGITADKRIISNIIVYNNTKGATISSQYYTLVIEGLAPILKIQAGSYISAGDSITVTILEGNLLYINGEQIKFSSVDLTNNTISGLQRGTNGTGQGVYYPENTEIFGIISNNQLDSTDYNQTWNSKTYNTVQGDPLQISTTASAIFLRGDVN